MPIRSQHVPSLKFRRFPNVIRVAFFWIFSNAPRRNKNDVKKSTTEIKNVLPHESVSV